MLLIRLHSKGGALVVTRKHCNLGHFILNANFLLSFIHSHSQITHLGHDHTSLLSSHTWSFLFCCSLRNHHTMSQFNKQLTTTLTLPVRNSCLFRLFNVYVYITVICNVKFSQSRVRVQSTSPSPLSASVFSAR